MDRIKPRDMDLVKQLVRFNKPFWSVADLEKVLGREFASRFPDSVGGLIISS